MSEIFKPVPGYEGRYEVSDRGTVLSLLNHINLKHCIGSAGYPQVDLCKHGKRRSYPIHQLVAAAFIGQRPDGMVVCHRDGNKMNNRPENLRIDTPDSNNKDKILHGVTSKGETNKKAKLSSAEIIEIRKQRAQGILQRVIAAKFGVSRANIGYITRGITWQHLGANQ